MSQIPKKIIETPLVPIKLNEKQSEIVIPQREEFSVTTKHIAPTQKIDERKNPLVLQEREKITVPTQEGPKTIKIDEKKQPLVIPKREEFY